MAKVARPKQSAKSVVTQFENDWGDLAVDRPDVFVAWMMLTPQFAQAILDKHNTHNRNVNKRLVSKYAKLIAEDRWIETGEPGIIDAEGVACSLQHRCLAVIEAKKAVTILMVVGVDARTRWIVDSGRSKRAVDRIVMADDSTKDPGSVASSYRWLLRYMFGCVTDVAATANITDFDLEAAMKEFPGIPQCVYDMNGLRNRFGGRGLHGWLLWEFRRRDPELTKEYVACVRDGVVPSRDSIWFSLNRRLVNNAECAQVHSRHTVTIAAWTIKAWNIARSGGRARNLVWRIDEPFPEIA